jgi:hypothetical protein
MINIIALLWNYRQWAAFGFLLLCIPCAYGIGYYDGAQTAKTEIRIQTIEKIVEVQKKNAKRKQEIIRLDDDALVRRYCKWVYDMPYAECIRTVKPVP